MTEFEKRCAEACPEGCGKGLHQFKNCSCGEAKPHHHIAPPLPDCSNTGEIVIGKSELILCTATPTESQYIEELVKEIAELEAGFDLRWKADMRAIERWRKGDPQRQLVLPDHADLCVWLLEERDSLKAQVEELTKIGEGNDWKRKAEEYEKAFAALKSVAAASARMACEQREALARGDAWKDRSERLERELTEAIRDLQAIDKLCHTLNGVPGGTIQKIARTALGKMEKR